MNAWLTAAAEPLVHAASTPALRPCLWLSLARNGVFCLRSNEAKNNNSYPKQVCFQDDHASGLDRAARPSRAKLGAELRITSQIEGV
jgi:hypothetical protein